jgi:glycosidase
MPGAPLVYNGQELGVTDSVSFFARTPYDWTQTPEIRDFYREYLTLYGESPALRTGTLTVHTPQAEDVLVYERATDTDSLLVAVNVRDASTEVTVPEGYAGQSLTDALTGTAVEGETMTLDAYEYHILQTGE